MQLPPLLMFGDVPEPGRDSRQSQPSDILDDAPPSPALTMPTHQLIRTDPVASQGSQDIRRSDSFPDPSNPDPFAAQWWKAIRVKGRKIPFGPRQTSGQPVRRAKLEDQIGWDSINIVWICKLEFRRTAYRDVP